MTRRITVPMDNQTKRMPPSAVPDNPKNSKSKGKAFDSAGKSVRRAGIQGNEGKLNIPFRDFGRAGSVGASRKDSGIELKVFQNRAAQARVQIAIAGIVKIIGTGSKSV